MTGQFAGDDADKRADQDVSGIVDPGMYPRIADQGGGGAQRRREGRQGQGRRNRKDRVRCIQRLWYLPNKFLI